MVLPNASTCKKGERRRRNITLKGNLRQKRFSAVNEEEKGRQPTRIVDDLKAEKKKMRTFLGGDHPFLLQKKRQYLPL